jgi:hypothetical protein
VTRPRSPALFQQLEKHFVRVILSCYSLHALGYARATRNGNGPRYMPSRVVYFESTRRSLPPSPFGVGVTQQFRDYHGGP